MGTNSAPLIANLFLFCHERDFMMSVSRDKATEIIEAFNSTSRYLDDLLNIVARLTDRARNDLKCVEGP